MPQGRVRLAGWAASLANHLVRRVDVLNRGYSGFNTRQALALLPKIFPKPLEGEERLLFATIFFGANDAAGADERVPNELQHVPLSEYEANLGRIVRHVSACCEHVILIAPPPVDSQRWPDRSNAAVERYGAAARRVAAQEGVSFVDSYAEFTGSKRKFHELTNDGLHLSGLGNSVVWGALLRVLPPAIQKPMGPQGLGIDFPEWRDVSPSNPEQSLEDAAAGKLPYPCRLDTKQK
ncbi:unnamed protein product [Polarella glacialis]|uniref:SGNH hydrolase-type esterase domain-containing protein n=1 Tax=Polarella glacialis TaxID=89957 RepID=A0A813HFD9_POLGL|nr:unnamed protein product [Polarella glacialis]